MPYIKQELRNQIDGNIAVLAVQIADKLSKTDVDFAGILNYTISTLISKILILKFDKLRYWHSPLVRGVLMDVADEFYRRIISPYEDEQIKNNGDVESFKELKARQG